MSMKMKDHDNSLILSNHNAMEGLIYSPSALNRKSTFPALSLFLHDEEIKDVPPWGTRIPPEVISYLNISAIIQTADLPPNTQISIHLRAVDGSIEYKTAPAPVSKPEPFRFVIPRTELVRFIGKTLTCAYRIKVGEQSEIVGSERTVQIRHPLAYSPPVIEGVTEEGLIVANYPNGLNVDLAPIANIEPLNKIHCFWNVLIREGNQFISIYDWHITVAATDQPYRFRVPVEAYTGHPPQAFAGCGVETNLFPVGTSIYGWGFGGNSNIIMI